MGQRADLQCFYPPQHIQVHEGQGWRPQLDGRVQKLRDGRRLLPPPGISGHAENPGVDRQNQVYRG